MQFPDDSGAPDRYPFTVPPDPKKAGKGIGFLRDGADLDRYELYMYPEEEINRVINYWTAGARRAG